MQRWNLTEVWTTLKWTSFSGVVNLVNSQQLTTIMKVNLWLAEANATTWGCDDTPSQILLKSFKATHYFRNLAIKNRGVILFSRQQKKVDKSKKEKSSPPPEVLWQFTLTVQDCSSLLYFYKFHAQLDEAEITCRFFAAVTKDLLIISGFGRKEKHVWYHQTSYRICMQLGKLFTPVSAFPLELEHRPVWEQFWGGGSRQTFLKIHRNSYERCRGSSLVLFHHYFILTSVPPSRMSVWVHRS